MPLRDAPALYADLGASGGLGRLLVHPETDLARTVPLGPPKSEGVGVAVLGAGVFARAALLPALASCGESVSLRHVVSARGASARFLGEYTAKGLLPLDPFISIDVDGVGELVRIGVERGRAARPDLKLGICGEHGGDPASVRFCHEAGLDYVSCSPFRVPIARLAAAQAALAKK